MREQDPFCQFDTQDDCIFIGDSYAIAASVQAQDKSNRIRLRFSSTKDLQKAVQEIVMQNNLTSNPAYRVTKDDVMCVLRIDRIG